MRYLLGVAVALAQLAGRFELEADVDALASSAGAGPCGGAHDVLPTRETTKRRRRGGADEDLDEAAYRGGAVVVEVRVRGSRSAGCHAAAHRTTRLEPLANPVSRQVRLV